MSVIASLKLIEFKPQNASSAIFVHRRKLADKIAQQINLASDLVYTPTKIVTVTAENGTAQRREVAKRIKRWWVTNADGSVHLIPTCIDHDPCAQLRRPMVMMRQGWSMSLFQASQQWSTMLS